MQTKLGPAWTERGRPPAGYFTKRLAEDWLRDVFEQARRGTLPGMVVTGATFADAAAEYLRYAEHDRSLKPSTLRGYRSIVSAYLLPAFGRRRLEDITKAEIERWRSSLESAAGRQAWAGEQLEEPDPDAPARDLRPGLQDLRAAGQSGGGRRASSGPLSEDIEVFAPRRSGRWCGPRHPSRTPRSTSRPPSPACAAASCLRSVGATSTSPGRSRVSGQLCGGGADRRRSQARSARCLWRPTSRGARRAFAGANGSPTRTTWSSSASPVASWTARLCGAATRRLSACRPASAALP